MRRRRSTHRDLPLWFCSCYVLICGPDMPSPEDTLTTFEIDRDLYAIGTREKRVTLYSQQTRALNLVWALTELHNSGKRPFRKVAVIGAGAAGLTAAAALMGAPGNKEIWLFERQWDFCPMQQGCDGRWLHPRIYNWPETGSRAPSAGLPVLNWTEGRASDVARTLLEAFNKYRTNDNRHEFRAYLGVHYLKINSTNKQITWMGTQADFDTSPYAARGKPEGATTDFDVIILATGFGFERVDPLYPTASYWRNDQLAQLHREADQKHYVVSGFGDGALIDACRLTIDRFRQDTVIYEIFGENPDRFEQFLRDHLKNPTANLFDFFGHIYEEHLADPRGKLQRRVREDTSVTLNINGGKPEGNPFSVIFGPGSSVLNRLLVYLLFRCGAITVEHRQLKMRVKERNIPRGNVIIRHGCDTLQQLGELFEDFSVVRSSFDDMYDNQRQAPKPFWPPGFYPVLQAA